MLVGGFGMSRVFQSLFATCLLLGSPAGAQTVLWQKTGVTFDEIFGGSASGIGDLDGDGLPDVLVGAPGQDGPGGLPNVGRVDALRGTTGALLFQISGSSNLESLGVRIAGVGDLNGDGTPDFAATSNLGVQARSGIAGAVLWIHPMIPSSVSGLGDLDGDGVPDVLAGFQFGGGGPTGSTRALSGTTGAMLLEIAGAVPGGLFGSSVSGTGDLSGDGVPDFLGGAPSCLTFCGPSPMAYAEVISGAIGAPLFLVGPFFPASAFGRAVTGLGDVSGDGIPDFVVGAPWLSSAPSFTPGEVRVYSGASGLQLYVVGIGASPLVDGLGWSLADPGDVNGDGVPDVLAGAPYGGSDRFGRAVVLSGDTGALLMTLAPGPASSPGSFGRALAAPGDCDGDGFPDLLVGETRAGLPGRAYLFSGAPEGITSYGAGCPGSAGVVPRIGATGVPSTGATLSIHLSSSPALTDAVLLVGTSNATWAGVPLPLNLAFLGMPSCLLLAAPDYAFATLTAGPGLAAGSATFDFPIPSALSLVGTVLHAQWYIVDPGPAPVPGTVTRGLSITIQP